MLSTRDILRKIKAVTNIQQICKAMKTVSSIKLKKAEERVNSAIPYANGIKKMVSSLTKVEREHPLFKGNESGKRVVVVVGADKGLAGSFNTNLLKYANNYITGHDGDIGTIPIGRKVCDNFNYRNYEVCMSVPLIGGEPEFFTYAAIADQLVDLYLKGEINGADIIYTAGGKVLEEQLLPIENIACDNEKKGYINEPSDIIFEPSVSTILSRLLPRYLRTVIYSSVLSSLAAEHSARVAAMSLAADNAEELIGNLTTEYNKSRQTTITNELIDIVGAAEALN